MHRAAPARDQHGHAMTLAEANVFDAEVPLTSHRDILMSQSVDRPDGPMRSPTVGVCSSGASRSGERDHRRDLSVSPQCCRADQWLTADGVTRAAPIAKD